MKFKKWLNKVTKIFVVLGMVLSMCFTAGNTNTVEAWDSGIPHEFTRIKSITYPEWWKRKCPQITKQWSTYMCKYNGQWSYCLEASKRTPSSGNYAANVINNNVMVRKFLYYGFGGPAQCLFKGQVLKDDGLNEAETGYLYTHVLLSLAYSGDMCGANIDDLERAGIGLKSTWQYVEGLPDPSNGANFSTGDTASLKATFDKANMIQTTNTVSFNASSNETVQLPLQSNVTIHIAGSSAQQTGGTATVWGGQSFYLTAPLENSPTDYTSGTLNSSAKGKFCALAIS
ncbi:thioester domain-containing protein, partial [Faecalibacillus intestinalis]|uniref:thioester domain-containing protein n=1 Tax=Faecalibacillus intestinalis TaxID=1982626 RepID=UPI003990E99C